MFSLRSAYVLALAAITLFAAPASAQFYLNPPKFAADAVTGAEPGMTLPLIGATPEEQRAALLWNMRSALNVAALQCGFEPTLLTLNHYNAMLANHRAELAASFDTLSKYFKRSAKTAKEGQTSLDQYGTRTYQSFTAVGGQRTFCQIAGETGRDAIWAPRGGLSIVAANRLRALRGSLIPTREPLITNPWLRSGQYATPNLSEQCWDKKGVWRKRCDPKPVKS